jgi:BASS family bile acid:Na+ symporter
MNRVLNIFNRLFVVWVTVAGTAAFFYPTVFTPLQHNMNWFFGLVMFGVGLVLDPNEFVNVVQDFRSVLIGVVSQFTIMPFLAFGVAYLFAFSDDFTLGLILTGSAPGAMSSNILSYLAGADVVYSVSLTAVSTLLAPLMTPLLTLLLANTVLEIPFLSMMLSVCFMVLIPLLLGIAVKKFFPGRVRPLARAAPALSTLFIVLICAVIIALNKEYILQINKWIFLAVMILNILGMVLGYMIGNLSRFSLLKKRALTIEIGMQNAGLGSVLALTHFNERVALPAVIFVFMCIFSASILVTLWSRESNTNSAGE